MNQVDELRAPAHQLTAASEFGCRIANCANEPVVLLGKKVHGIAKNLGGMLKFLQSAGAGIEKATDLPIAFGFYGTMESPAVYFPAEIAGAHN